MPENNNLTTRELFAKLLDVVESNHKAQQQTVEALKELSIKLTACETMLAGKLAAVSEKQQDLNGKLESRLWYVIILLIVALCAAVGIKLILPSLA